MTKRFWQLANLISLAFALIANFIVSTRVIDVPPINQVSDLYATALTPATYAFGIWSLIYALLVAFVIYQARDLFHPNPDNKLPAATGPYFTLASILNGVWTYLFVKDFIGLSVVVLLVLTAALYTVIFKLGIAVAAAPAKQKFLAWWPLLLYTGWVTVATVVNIASWLASRGVTFGPVTASVVVAILCAALMMILVRRRAYALALSSGWGIIAIGVRQQQLGGSSLLMLTALTAGAVLILGAGVLAIVKRTEPSGDSTNSASNTNSTKR